MLLVKYILSMAVGGIILLHSVVHHEHNIKINNTPEFLAHECSTTLFDGVKLTFGIDHGDGHLEQFTHLELDCPELTLIEIQEVFHEDDRKVTPGSRIPYAYLNLSPEPLRGPPYHNS